MTKLREKQIAACKLLTVNYLTINNSNFLPPVLKMQLTGRKFDAPTCQYQLRRKAIAEYTRRAAQLKMSH